MPISLIHPRDFRGVQRLPFCYLCAKEFIAGDDRNRDHVPPKAMFAAKDRLPLILSTHKACNGAQKLTDEKMAQFLGMHRGEMPVAPANRRLRFRQVGNSTAITNLNIDEAIWRWIRGFHAALYREAIAAPIRGSLVTPFIRIDPKPYGRVVVPLRSQHSEFVETIKLNRAKRNLDRIVCNRSAMTYECVWTQTKANRLWLCVFALDVYAWKDFGDSNFPRRGCAGFYVLPDSGLPGNAARGMDSPIIVPNVDKLDAFAL